MLTYLKLRANIFLAVKKLTYCAPLDQLVEQLTLNQWVWGSSPQRCIAAARFCKCIGCGVSLLFLYENSGCPSRHPFLISFSIFYNFLAGGAGILSLSCRFLYRTTSFLSAGAAFPILSLFSSSALRILFCHSNFSAVSISAAVLCP